MGRVENKVAMVTGAASGLGKASARLLAAEGARVVLSDRKTEGGEALAAEIGGGAVFLPLDVTQPAAWVSVMDEVIRRFGGLDVLVNSAGVGVAGDFEQATLEEFRFVHAVNLEGTFLGCQQAIRAMKPRKGGSIVNLSSVAGLVADPTLAAYCSSKAGVRLLSKSVALHCAQRGYGIRCNSVHPSFIATPMVDAMITGAADPAKMRHLLEKAAPLGHLGEPSDVAFLVLYLASDESRFVTGAELVIDGGLTAR